MSRNGLLAEQLEAHFSDRVRVIDEFTDLCTVSVAAAELLDVARTLKVDPEFQFAQLTDLCGVDYSLYKKGEWETDEVSKAGFSRAAEATSSARLRFGDESPSSSTDRPRFAAVYHLISYSHNRRLRVRVYAEDDQQPRFPSVVSIWPSADWYEREAFDLFGFVFEGHPDLRRILTDYGFVGHPFRKDFPLIGHVEMRFDPERGRVVYEPVSIEPRVLVPKVQRSDNRYVGKDLSAGGEDHA